MNRSRVIALVIVILLVIPAILLVTSGDFFPQEEKPYKVCFISESGKDTVFVRNALEGLYYATLSGNVTAELYRVSNETLESYWDKTKKAMDNGADMILAAGYETGANLPPVAVLAPQISFLMVDADITSNLPDNYANIVFRNNEPSFIAGYIAGLMTETGKIGFLGGIDADSVRQFYYGFKAGIDTAAIESQRQLELIPYYTNSFSDEEKGYLGAKTLYEKGADIVFTVAGDSGVGGIQAAKDMGKYVIGVDTDQNYLAPLNVLFSVTKSLPTVVSKVVLEYAKGSMNRTMDGIISVGYAEDGFDIASIIEAVPPSLVMSAEYLESLIQEGKLDIPATKAEYDVWVPQKIIYG